MTANLPGYCDALMTKRRRCRQGSVNSHGSASLALQPSAIVGPMAKPLKWERAHVEGHGPSEVWRAKTGNGYLVAFGSGNTPSCVVYVPESNWKVKSEEKHLAQAKKSQSP